METPLVSVIVPNYNYAAYLPDCIHSVLSQTIKNIECIVVDDGSTDNSVEVLRKLSSEDSRLHIVLKSNSGPGMSRNEGMKCAAGRYISFIDSDDKWGARKLENQLNVMNKMNADFIFSNSSLFDNKGTIHKIEYKSRSLTVYDFIAGNPISGSASSVMMKREVFEKVGFFETQSRYAEDLNYWFVCFFNKFKFAHCSSYDVFVRSHSGSVTKTFYNRMFDFNLLILERELRMLKEMKYEMEQKKFLAALSARLRGARWYARDSRDYKRILLSYSAGIKMYGIGYMFQTNVFEDLYIDAKQILLPKRFGKFENK